MKTNYADVRTALEKLIQKATENDICSEDYRELCASLNVAKMYYDMDVGGRYIDPKTDKLIVADKVEGQNIILYDSGKKTDIKRKYTYFYGKLEYVHAYIEFEEGVEEEQFDEKMLQFLADQIFLLVSRQNIRMMLDYAELYDDFTSIPNIRFLKKRFNKLVQTQPSENFAVLYINLCNFKYINEIGGVDAGDEAIIMYSRILHSIMKNDECVCHMGGDNYAMFIKRERLDEMLDILKDVKVSGLSAIPGKEFHISAWVGVSAGSPENIDVRIDQASVAHAMGKVILKKTVTFYDAELANAFRREREITAMFRPAAAAHEFVPFFQPKVNMLTGELIGFEALCRWKHEGGFIYPDQFIPVLDRQGLIHELDMIMLNETCLIMKKWQEMGLELPVVSFNVSRKNLFVPNIEDKIFGIIQKNGVDINLLEMEITETAKEDEFGRLIEFLTILKNRGLKVSIDDFGTGYSSLSLIHNVKADIIKIDRSFVSTLLSDERSKVLTETIIQIARRFGMDVIAEGVETEEEGRILTKLGCINAQGYYYSRPVDFETAAKMIEKGRFEPIK